MEAAPGRVAEAAAGLARRWQALRRRHVAVSFGCACGAPAGHVGLAEIEEDVLAFLRHRHPAGQDAGIDAAFARGMDGGAGLVALLDSVAAWPGDGGQPMALLVADAQRCIRSCERTVGRRRGLQADAVIPEQ